MLNFRSVNLCLICVFQINITNNVINNFSAGFGINDFWNVDYDRRYLETYLKSYCRWNGKREATV